jgi:hydroxymethylbilane synthase
LEQALLAGQVDVAVHSLKDVPVTMPLVDQTNLVIAAVPAREDVHDVLVCGTAQTIQELQAGARVGTSSLRRRCQILALRPDLHPEPIRGNIDTRLRKLHSGQYDALILARAGLNRSGLLDARTMANIPLEQMLPAAAQGALAIQCRRDDPQTMQLVKVLNDPATQACVTVERQLVQALGGDCHSPIAALATVTDGRLLIRAAVGARGGNVPVITAEGTSSVAESAQALHAVIKALEDQGARNLLGH